MRELIALFLWVSDAVAVRSSGGGLGRRTIEETRRNHAAAVTTNRRDLHRHSD